jgi:hypothetical protein
MLLNPVGVSNDGSNIVHEMEKIYQLCSLYKGTESKIQLRSNDTFWDEFAPLLPSNDTFWDEFARLFGNQNGWKNSLFSLQSPKQIAEHNYNGT